MNYSQHLKTSPQSEPAFGKKMVQNAAGGYVFEITNFQRLRRFLILGCEGGTYYEGERKLTLENAACILDCLKEDGIKTVNLIVDISNKGLAIKNDAAIFALAVASKHGDTETRRYANQSLTSVCRIGTHLFQFAEARQAVGGWGRGVRNAVARWYKYKEDLVNQALKYQQRNGWSHADLLRLSHPTSNGKSNPLYDAILHPEKWNEVQDPLAEGYVKIQKAENAKEAAQLITEYKLPRELVPTQYLTDALVWEALLPHMPMTATIRNLGNLSKCGLLAPLSDAVQIVVARLTDETAIKKARIHPFAVLLASKTYASGRGFKSDSAWKVVPQVVDALDTTYELAFHNALPTNKRFVLGVDVSGSMTSLINNSNISSAEAAAAMAHITARTEPNYFIGGFSTQFVDLGITAKDTLNTVMTKTKDRNFGGTDTSVAIAYALKNKINADVFCIYTDNETWAGDQHSFQTLSDYRQKTGIPAKLAVMAFTPTRHSIAYQADAGSMDFTGLSADLPQALSAFVTE